MPAIENNCIHPLTVDIDRLQTVFLSEYYVQTFKSQTYNIVINVSKLFQFYFLIDSCIFSYDFYHEILEGKYILICNVVNNLKYFLECIK